MTSAVLCKSADSCTRTWRDCSFNDSGDFTIFFLAAHGLTYFWLKMAAYHRNTLLCDCHAVEKHTKVLVIGPIRFKATPDHEQEMI